MDPTEYQKLIQSSIEYLKSALENNTGSAKNPVTNDAKAVIPNTDILSICKDIAKLKECAPTKPTPIKTEPSENGHIKLVPLANLMPSVQTIVLDSDDNSDCDQISTTSSHLERLTDKSESTTVDKTSKKVNDKLLDNGNSSSSTKTVKHRDKKQASTFSQSLRLSSSSSDGNDDQTPSVQKSPSISSDDEPTSLAAADALANDKSLSDDDGGTTSIITGDTVKPNKRLSVKVYKLSDTIMKKYRLKQIVDDEQKVIAKAAEDENVVHSKKEVTPKSASIMCWINRQKIFLFLCL